MCMHRTSDAVYNPLWQGAKIQHSEGRGDPAMQDLLEQPSCCSWGPGWFSFSEGRGDPAMRDILISIVNNPVASGGDLIGSVSLRVGATQPCVTIYF